MENLRRKEVMQELGVESATAVSISTPKKIKKKGKGCSHKI